MWASTHTQLVASRKFQFAVLNGPQRTRKLPLGAENYAKVPDSQPRGIEISRHQEFPDRRRNYATARPPSFICEV